MKYTPVIGLEVHVELDTKSKMYCSCSAYHFNVPPNTHTCPTCLGLPGALPIVNKVACEYCMKIGLALNCSLNKDAVFARKHYAYPDLSKGYQLTQYELPFCIEGWIEIKGRRIGIRRVHMEEDTGKLQHASHEGKDISLVDFNRSGVPLVEIVTEADFSTVEDVEEYARSLQQLMRYLKVSSADMDKGSMRFEANISLRKDSDPTDSMPPYKVEVKNLNSFKALTGAINYELKIQAEHLDKNEIPSQDTKGWNDLKNQTYSQRSKEDAHDYRYFPDPDISPMRWMKAEESKLRDSLPELPWAKKKRYLTEYALSEYDASLLTLETELSVFFESGLKNISEADKKAIAKKLSNWINGEFARLRNIHQTTLQELKFKAADVIELIQLIDSGKISGTNAKVVFEEMYINGGAPAQIIKDKGLEQIQDSSAVENAVKKVIDEQTKAVEDYRKGKETVIQFLIGMVMKELKGRGNTEEIKEIFKKQL